MEDNINLDDEEYFIKDTLNEEDRKKSINKLLLKIFKFLLEHMKSLYYLRKQ